MGIRKLAVVLAGLTSLGAAAPSERIVEGSGIVGGTVNGVPARIQIDPGATAMPLITSRMARKAGLEPSFMEIEYQIGPHHVKGDSAIGTIDAGSGPDKRRIGWSEKPWRPGIDGAIGPGMLDEPVVRFRLRPQRPGERSASFPLVDQGNLDGRWGERFAAIKLGGRTVRVKFAPHARETIATAQAGALIAQELGGRWNGAPQSMPIAFGIARPVRALILERPLTIGPVSLQSLKVRTHDFGSSSAIRDEAAMDPNEIVVTAPKKRKAKYDQMELGADVLDRCSTIVFDRRAKRITLTCLAA